MKTFLLDTHIFIWWMTEDKRLTNKVREVITNQDNRILMSVISAWEMELKKNSLPNFSMSISVHNAIKKGGFSMLDVQLKHVASLVDLPPIHKDPFDRMLIAQAIAEGAALLSADRTISKYPGLQVLF